MSFISLSKNKKVVFSEILKSLFLTQKKNKKKKEEEEEEEEGRSKILH